MILDFEDNKVIVSKAREAANFEHKLLKYIKSQVGSFYHSSLLSSSYSTWSKEHFPDELCVENESDWFKVYLSRDANLSIMSNSFKAQDRVNNYKLKNYNNEHKAVSQYYFEQIMKEIDSRGWSHDIKTIKIKFNL